MSKEEKQSVCVVGLGAAGLVCVKELRAHGFRVTGVDGGTQVGGRWALNEYNSSQNRHFGVWKELYLNSSRPLMEFSDFPWNKQDYKDNPEVEPDLGGQYPHCTETKAYLEAYVSHFHLMDEGIELETLVESVEQEPNGGQGWIVTIKSLKPGSKSIRRHFDFLVLCLGLHAVPKNPLLKPDGTGSLNGFTGKVMHASEITSLEEMDGKRVLVVGSCISGTDLSSSLATRGRCDKLVNSVRHVPYTADRFSPVNNMPIDHLMFYRLLVYLNRYMPDSVNSDGFKSFVLQYFPNQLTETMTGDASLFPVDDIQKAGATFCSNYVDNVKGGSLRLKPEIHSSSGCTITFKDGSKEDFDIIICGTGYSMDLSLLPKEVREDVAFLNPHSGTFEVALYKYTLAPGWNDLAFSGQFNIYGAHFPTAEMQARYIAKVFKGDVPRPSDAKLQAGVARFKDYRLGGPHHTAELATMIQEDIGDELGLTPSVLSMLWNPKTLLLGTIFPCFYRTNENIDDPEVARKAQEQLDWYYSHQDSFLRSDEQ